ncbi:MAG: 23S rRNA (guanosine(2251)-2'-O)-methyltransferase RlmB [Clostridia bacterium]|nr:23S rRNA (guanosine(2251)-2'-O)-methyltransferase RlmB [Clostridia bacterium]
MPEHRPLPPSKPVAYQEEEPTENLLTGRNPIREALKSGRDIERLLVAKGDLSGTAQQIVAMAREARVPVQMVERNRLDELAKNHQGMIAFASAYQYADVDDMLSLAEERNEDPFLIILDGVTDPHNLGAVIRTAAAVGAHGVIVPERRAVGLTPAAVKASAGGIEHIKVARVTNLTNEIKKLKSRGIWLYGADAEGESFRQVDFSGPCALVIGSEGDGISRLVLEQCDRVVSIPMRNSAMESLNASVAAGILLYAASASRE